MPPWMLADETLDTIRELMNAAVGRAGDSLSEVVGQPISISMADMQIYRSHHGDAGLSDKLHHAETVISQTFEGTISGRAAVCFPADSGLALARLLSSEISTSVDGLDAELSGILLEVGNLVLNAVMGTLSNIMLTNLQYNLPELQSANRPGDRAWQDTRRKEDILIGEIGFSIANQPIAGSIVLTFTADSLARFLHGVLSPEFV